MNEKPQTDPASRPVQEWVVRVRAFLEPGAEELATKITTEYASAIGAIAVVEPEVLLFQSEAMTDDAEDMQTRFLDIMEQRMLAHGFDAHQIECCKLVLMDYTTREIIDTLYSTESKVNTAIRTALDILGCGNRSGLAAHLLAKNPKQRKTYMPATTTKIPVTITESPEIRTMIDTALTQRRKQNAQLFKLAPREAEISDLIAEGLTNAQIGERLCISAATVKSHIARIFIKLDCSNRAEVVGRLNGIV